MARTLPVRGSTMASPPIASSLGKTCLRTDSSAAFWKRGSIVVWTVRPPESRRLSRALLVLPRAGSRLR